MTRRPGAPDSLRVIDVDPGGFRAAVARLVDDGGRVQALFAADPGTGLEVRCTASDGDGDLLLRCPAVDVTVESIVGLLPALAWDEREARDLYGVTFAGHAPHRPLVHHPADLASWTTPVFGEDVHQVAVGPIHAGVIESGHFRFHLVGERVLKLDPQLFSKHRGLERAAEGHTAAEAHPVIQRACAACAVTNAVAYAQSVEQARGLWPDEDLRRMRTLLLELERMYNHLNDIGAVCASIGFAAGTMIFAAFKERAQRVNMLLLGHRFLFDTVGVAVGSAAIDPADAARARIEVDELRGDALRAWRQVLFDASVRDRFVGAGVLSSGDAARLGTVGPQARASGLDHDVREESPRLWYPGFRAALPPEPAGDVAARVEARAVELAATFAIVDDLLADPPGPGGTDAFDLPGRFGVGRVESPRGETVCAVELDGGTVARVHLRTGSYANWPSVARAAEGGIVPDFPLVNKSFELCYACVDR
jgi:Ni,Fe-hydrogenase III large subunit